MSKFFSRSSSPSHRQIERFGMTFGVFGVSLLLLLGGGLTSSIANSAGKTQNTAIYTSTFVTSKTQLTGKVPGVYVSPNRERALVLMQFDPQQKGSFSADAKNYQAYLTGSDNNAQPEPLRTKITGQLVMFGTTGYLGVIMDSETPIPDQAMNLTVRANSELVQPSESARQELRSDMQNQSSFQKFDQWRVYVNPGSSAATVTDSLSGSRLDMADIYYDIAIKDRESAARDALDKQLQKMQIDLAKINEYTAQMAIPVNGLYIVPPTVPVQIAGDAVTGTAATEPQPTPGATPTPAATQNVARDDESTDAPAPEATDDAATPTPEPSSPAAGSSISTLKLETDWVSPRGYDFDWRSSSVRQGYLDAIVPANTSYVSYIIQKAKQPEVAPGEPTFDTGTSMKWMLKDGSDLNRDYTTQSQISMVQPLLDVKNNLTQAYQTYYTDKITYQVDLYSALVNLEVELRNADSGVSKNTSEQALFIY